jgi:hypothetical protein
MAAIRCADNRAPESHDSTNTFAIENNVIAWRKEAFESVTKTDHFPAEFFPLPALLRAERR